MAAEAVRQSSHQSGRGQDPYRIMVVDDSSLIRNMIGRWLSSEEGLEVVASCRNGRQALDAIANADCDVVVLDIEMPEMDGLTALPKLIEACPHVQVVMASTLTHRNADISIRALQMGAADYVAKPEAVAGGHGADAFRRELLNKVRALGAAGRRARLTKGKAAAPVPGAVEAETPIRLRKPSTARPRILAIGSSTGGPQALFQFLKELPSGISVPILIAQHMPATFTALLAQHLGRISTFESAEGANGVPVESGRIYVAPGGYHMVVEDRKGKPVITLNEDAPEHFCRPSVNPLFRSVSRVYGASALAVVLTGMGSDGLEGATDLVEAGGTLIAQDEATSIVWGMPGIVAKAGLCSAVLPLQDIAKTVDGLLKGTGL